MNYDRIVLAHGSGGQLGNDLVEKRFLPFLSNSILDKLNDQGVFELGKQRMAFTTDSYVVSPIFFPGGTIGDLAVNGTVNDVSMCGATPMYLSLGLILEEGLPLEELDRIMLSIQESTREAGVQIVTGDTKVVPKGSADKIFINTAGVGVLDAGVCISADNVRVGDAILVSGFIADHGMAIMSVREGLVFDNPILSDSAPLNGLVRDMMASGAEIHAMRDPTRGGLAATLNEFARSSGVGIAIGETELPVRPEVAEACRLLGLDPVRVANEGKLVAAVRDSDAESLLEVMRRNPRGGDSRIIGTVVAGPKNTVVMKTAKGDTRIVDMVVGGSLPRIC